MNSPSFLLHFQHHVNFQQDIIAGIEMQINISLFCVQLLLCFSMLEKELGNILLHKCHLRKQAELIPSHPISTKIVVNVPLTSGKVCQQMSGLQEHFRWGYRNPEINWGVDVAELPRSFYLSLKIQVTFFLLPVYFEGHCSRLPGSNILCCQDLWMWKSHLWLTSCQACKNQALVKSARADPLCLWHLFIWGGNAEFHRLAKHKRMDCVTRCAFSQQPQHHICMPAVCQWHTAPWKRRSPHHGWDALPQPDPSRSPLWLRGKQRHPGSEERIRKPGGPSRLEAWAWGSSGAGSGRWNLKSEAQSTSLVSYF